MEKHYFYNPGLKKEDRVVLLTEQEFYHLDRVLRLKESDSVYLLNGKGLVAQGEIKSKTETSAEIIILSNSFFKKPRNIILLQSLIKKDAMDLVIEKAQELGLSALWPVIASRSVVKIGHGKKSQNKLERWQRIAIEAMKQSGSPYLMEILEPGSFRDILSKLSKEESKYILNKYGQEAKTIIGSDLGDILLLIGPEGGFTEEEYKEADSYGFKSISLGESRLRSETAAISAVSIFKCLIS
ncbi:MAG: RsmE family RNA methyltransferase [Candidatus Kaelpia imicola]|nr:RsmE family RNA methyltransferase [Candidatus Kaelpia imicola]